LNLRPPKLRVSINTDHEGKQYEHVYWYFRIKPKSWRSRSCTAVFIDFDDAPTIAAAWRLAMVEIDARGLR
jgi:hypothetical protein